MFSVAILGIYLIYGGFLALVLFGLYKVLSVLLGRYLDAKREHTAAVREQSVALREIAAALKDR